jgi:hypothetical protein
VSEKDIEDEDSELLLVRSVDRLPVVDNLGEDTNEVEGMAFEWVSRTGNFAGRLRRGVLKVMSKVSSESSSSLSTSILSPSLLLSWI